MLVIIKMSPFKEIKTDWRGSFCDRLYEAVYAAVELGRLRNVSLRVGQLSSQDLGYSASHHIPLLSTMEPWHSLHRETHN